MSNLDRYISAALFGVSIFLILNQLRYSFNIEHEGKQNGGSNMASNILRLDFEVFGTVQGVFFRKYTYDQATKLGLRGRVRNTPEGTVQGTLEGPVDQVNNMKNWLKMEGSPQSRIDDTKFRNERIVDKYEYENFEIQRRPKS